MPGVNVIRMNSAQKHRDEEENEEGEDDEMKDSFAEDTLEV